MLLYQTRIEHGTPHAPSYYVRTIEVLACGCVRVYDVTLPVGTYTVQCLDCQENDAEQDRYDPIGTYSDADGLSHDD